MPKPSKRKHPRLDPDAFVRAAERIDDYSDAFACNALWLGMGHTVEEAMSVSDWTVLRDALPEVVFFTAVLKPQVTVYGRHDAWYGTPVDGIFDTERLDRTARILGLLLCAELVKEGFKP